MGIEGGQEGRTGPNRSTRSSARSGAENASAKPRGKARKRNRRSRVIESDDEEPEPPPPPEPEPEPEPPRSPTPTPAPRTPSPLPLAASPFDMEADISKLEPATFTTIDRGPPEPMLRLSWNHKVNLMAEKVLNPLIYMCEKCDCPVLSYGRMIPCKHVLCYDCAKVQDQCWRCGDRAVRVERAGLGTLYMCLHDGKRYDNNGCRRTYLSQRDLQAHINHRHRRAPAAPRTPPPPPPPPPVVPEPRRPPEEKPVPAERRDPRSAEARGAPSFPSPSSGGLSPHGLHGPRVPAASYKSSPRGAGSRGSSPHGAGSVGSSPLGSGSHGAGGHRGHGGGHGSHGSGHGSHGSGHGSGHGSHGSGHGSHGSNHGSGHGSHGSGHGSLNSGHGSHGSSHGSNHGSGHGSAGHGPGHHGGFPAAKSAPALKQQQIPVISSQRSGNLITIPIQGQEPTQEPPPQPPPQPQPQYAAYTAPAYPAAHQTAGYAPPEPAPYYQSTPPPQTAGYGRSFPPPQVPPPVVRAAVPQQYPPVVQPPQPSQQPATWSSQPPPALGRYYR